MHEDGDLYELLARVFDRDDPAPNALPSLADLRVQMDLVKALEQKVAALEWEYEHSSYLIHEEPDLEELRP
jgi:hypothetical protein